MYILGNIFLHNYYTIYDLENDQIGMAPAKKMNYNSLRNFSPTQIVEESQSRLIEVTDVPDKLRVAQATNTF